MEFTDATLSGLDSGSDSSAEVELTDGLVDGLVDGPTDWSADGGLAESSAGRDAVDSSSMEMLLLTVHMRQKSFPLEPTWQASSLCMGLSPNRAQTNGTTTTSS